MPIADWRLTIGDWRLGIDGLAIGDWHCRLSIVDFGLALGS
jgi:hypothetical protein